MKVQVKGSMPVRSPRGRSRLGRLGAAAVAALGATALIASAAQASTISIGSVLPPGYTETEFGPLQTRFNTALPEKGANLTSPVDGAIVRWRVQGAEGGPFYLRVLHPTGSGAYKAVGTSNPATPVSTKLQTFTANLPVKAGDLIGIDPTNGTDKIGIATEVAGAGFATIFPPPFDGAIVPPSEAVSGQEIELSAEVQPTPKVTDVSPTSGSVLGGAEVTITGTDFNAAGEVKFGNVAATTYQVDSEEQITATAPRSTKVGSVDITVTTVAGTSAATRFDSFSYKGCVVPKLFGKKLKVAKNRLRNAGCRVGRVSKVRRRAAKRGKVVAQNPKPRKLLAPGAKVNLKVGK